MIKTEQFALGAEWDKAFHSRQGIMLPADLYNGGKNGVISWDMLEMFYRDSLQ